MKNDKLTITLAALLLILTIVIIQGTSESTEVEHTNSETDTEYSEGDIEAEAEIYELLVGHKSSKSYISEVTSNTQSLGISNNGVYISDSSLLISNAGSTDTNIDSELSQKIIYFPSKVIARISYNKDKVVLEYIAYINDNVECIHESELSNIIGIQTQSEECTDKVNNLLYSIFNKKQFNDKDDAESYQHFSNILKEIGNYSITALTYAKSSVQSKPNIVYMQVFGDDNQYYSIFIYLDKDENIRSIEAY